MLESCNRGLTTLSESGNAGNGKTDPSELTDRSREDASDDAFARVNQPVTLPVRMPPFSSARNPVGALWVNRTASTTTGSNVDLFIFLPSRSLCLGERNFNRSVVPHQEIILRDTVAYISCWSNQSNSDEPSSNTSSTSKR